MYAAYTGVWHVIEQMNFQSALINLPFHHVCSKSSITRYNARSIDSRIHGDVIISPFGDVEASWLTCKCNRQQARMALLYVEDSVDQVCA